MHMSREDLDVGMSRIERQYYEYCEWLAEQRGWTWDQADYFIGTGQTPDDVRRRFHCVDCAIDTMPTYPYLVRDEVWAAAGMEPNGGMLCIPCLEHRLGRALTSSDWG